MSAASITIGRPIGADHPPFVIAELSANHLAGGLRAGAGTLATDEGAATFRQLAQAVVRTDLEQLRGAERTAAQHTQPLWVQRDAATAEG